MKLKFFILLILITNIGLSQELIKYKNPNNVLNLEINSTNNTYSVTYIDRIDLRNLNNNSLIKSFSYEDLNSIYNINHTNSNNYLIADNDGNIWIKNNNTFYLFNGVDLTLIDSLNNKKIESVKSLKLAQNGDLIALFTDFIGIHNTFGWTFYNYSSNSIQTVDNNLFVFLEKSTTNLIIYNNGLVSKIETSINIQHIHITDNFIHFVGTDVNSSNLKFGKINKNNLLVSTFDLPPLINNNLLDMKVSNNYMYLKTLKTVFVFDINNTNSSNIFELDGNTNIEEFFANSDKGIFIISSSSTNFNDNLIRISFDGNTLQSQSINIPPYARSFNVFNNNFYYLDASELKQITPSNQLLTIKNYHKLIVNNIKINNGEFWFRTKTGLIRLLNNSETIISSSTKIPVMANAMAVNNTNNIFVAGIYNISKFEENKWVNVDLPETIQGEIKNILFDKEDNLWVATLKALYKLDSNNNLTEFSYDYFNIKHKMFSYDGQNIFIGSGNSILKFNIAKSDFKFIDFKGVSLYFDSIMSDSKGRTWIASNGYYEQAGLYEIVDNTIERIDNPSLDENNNQEKLNYISEGNDGKLWLSYEKGISIYNGNEFTNNYLFKNAPSSPSNSESIGKINFSGNQIFVNFPEDGVYTFENSKFTKILDYKTDFRIIIDDSILVNNELWYSHSKSGIISRLQNLTLSNEGLNYEKKNLTISPNPIEKNGKLNINFPQKKYEYCIYSLTGKNIKSGKTANNKIDTKGINKGLYILIIKNVNFSKSYKLIIN